jgi:sugar lactone lactonase YvrE
MDQTSPGREASMARAGFVVRLLEPCAVAAFLALVAACGGGGGEPARTVTTVTVTSPTSTPQQSDTVQLTAVARDQFADVVPGTTAAWSSSAPAVATVSATGLLQALAGGTVTVTATINGVTGTLSLTILATPIGVNYLVATYAGVAGSPGSDDGSIGKFNGPAGIAIDSAGTLYVADQLNHAIRTISKTGEVRTLAGVPDPRNCGYADGTGTKARFCLPVGVAVSGAGDVYVADFVNAVVRKISPAGVVSTLAGAAGIRGFVDGQGAQARFDVPACIATDRTGTIYVCDGGNNYAIRKITPAGMVSTLAVSRRPDGTIAGPGAALPPTPFGSPNGLAIDSEGNVYIASGNAVVARLTPAGAFSIVAGKLYEYGSVDGPAASAVLHTLFGVAVDRDHSVFMTEPFTHTVRRISGGGTVATLAGAAGSAGSADGLATEARFGSPHGIAVDDGGRLYVCDQAGHTIRKITPAWEQVRSPTVWRKH